MILNKPHGVFGFKSENSEKLAVSLHDPNPLHLGLDFAKTLHVLTYIATNNLPMNSIRRCAMNMRYRDTDDDEEPVTKCNKQLMRFLLVPKIIADHVYYTDGCNSVRDSMWCEWAYIFDFDYQQLEIYRGGNKDPEAAGKYAAVIHANGYCGVRMVAAINFDKIVEGKTSVLKAIMQDITYKTVKGKDLLKKGGQKKIVDKKYLGEEIMVF